ncbi:hypothetical protein [Algoriphagus confluentis]
MEYLEWDNRKKYTLVDYQKLNQFYENKVQKMSRSLDKMTDTSTSEFLYF